MFILLAFRPVPDYRVDVQLITAEGLNKRKEGKKDHLESQKTKKS